MIRFEELVSGEAEVLMKIPERMFEPSGLTIQSIGSYRWLWAVSDDGKVARRKLAHVNLSWQWLDLAGEEKDDFDFEAIFPVPGSTDLMLGIEGNGKQPKYAQLIAFTYDPRDTDSISAPEMSKHKHKLQNMPVADGKGMEGVTLVPNGHHPFEDVPPPFSGFILAGSQDKKAQHKLFGFAWDGEELDLKETWDKRGITCPDRSIAELHYDANHRILYALFDDEGSELHAYRWNAKSEFETIWSCQLPWHGVEGMTVDEEYLYLALDQSRKEAVVNNNMIPSTDHYHNMVLRYRWWGQTHALR